MKYGEALSRYLEKSGMSQAELAAAIGSPRSTINALVKGPAKEPTLSTAKSISDALGVSLDEMASVASGEYGSRNDRREMKTMRKQIADNIRRFRLERKMSVGDVGDAVGKSGKTISAWEVGRGQPDADAMIALCRLFSVDISDFYGTSADSDLNQEERELVVMFRSLPRDQKDAVITIAKTISKPSNQILEEGCDERSSINSGEETR